MTDNWFTLGSDSYCFHSLEFMISPMIFDDYFMAKELTFSPNTQNEHQFEDRIEQFCQMKGTFKEENESERVLYFLGL